MNTSAYYHIPISTCYPLVRSVRYSDIQNPIAFNIDNIYASVVVLDGLKSIIH